MRTTHGIILVDSRLKILCVHPTNAPIKFWSLPKGGENINETSLQAACRELYEETNLDLTLYINNLVYYEYLGAFNYKGANKQLNCHVIYINHPLSTCDLNLKCESMIDDTDVPECDLIKWKSIDFCLKKLHHTQVEALMECLKKIIKINQKKF